MMKAIVLLLMLLVGLLLAVDLSWFVRGSLEEFPTDEQIDKVRTVSGALAVVLILIEILLWRLLRSTRQLPTG